LVSNFSLYRKLLSYKREDPNTHFEGVLIENLTINVSSGSVESLHKDVAPGRELLFSFR